MSTLLIASILALVGIGLLLTNRAASSIGIDPDGRLRRPLAIFAIALAIVILAMGSFVTIDPGQLGVKIFFGRVETDVLENGFHIVNPLTEIVEMDARTQAYTMSGRSNEGQVQGDDAIEVLSGDGLTLKLEVTVQYHLTPATAPTVYRSLANDYVERVVRPESRAALRDAAVGFQATDLYSKRRGEFVLEVREKLSTSFARRGIELENVLLRDIQLPEKVRAAIDEKIAAEQEAQKMQYVLQREKQEAERKRVEAAGISDAQTIISSSLTNQYLQYNYISTLRELVKSDNATFVITPFDQKLTPMLNMNPPAR